MNSAPKRTSDFLSFAAIPLAIALCSNTKADDSTPTTPPTVVRTPIRVDTVHPTRYGNDYPHLPLNGEGGLCGVRIEVDTEGNVLATQLIVSTGVPRVDAECVLSSADVHFVPATINGTPITSWASTPVDINAVRTLRLPNDGQLTVPIIKSDYELRVGPHFYPFEARAAQQEGDCTVHVLVNENGATSNVTVTKSTHYDTLDQACILAIQRAAFVPAHKDGAAVAASTDINIFWRLPVK
jgi:TonB family protein